MDLVGFISNIVSTVDSTLVLASLVALFALLQEDVTVFIAGVIAADGIVPVPVVLSALLVGITLGDAALYAFGAFARTHPRLARYIDHGRAAPLRLWIGKRYALMACAAHFVPGLRFTTYVASGFFRFPLVTYIPMALLGGLLLVTVLFSAGYWFGSFSSGWVGTLRWSIAGVFLLALFFAGRYNVRAYRAMRETSAP